MRGRTAAVALAVAIVLIAAADVVVLARGGVLTTAPDAQQASGPPTPTSEATEEPDAGEPGDEDGDDDDAPAGAPQCDDPARRRVRVAFLGPLRGEFSVFGQGHLDAVVLAAAEANEAGCGRFTVEEFDTGGDTAQARRAAEQVRAGDFDAVIGPPFSGEVMAAGPVLDDAGLPFLAFAAADPVTGEQGWNHLFRLVADDADLARAAGRVLRDHGAGRVAVVSDGSDYGNEIGDAVARGLRRREVSVRETLGQPEQVAGRIAQSDADAVFFAGYPPDAVPLLEALAETDAADLPFLGAEGLLDQSFASADAADGVEILSPAVLPGTGAFGVAFAAEYGTEPVFLAAEAHASMRLVGEAFGNGVRNRRDLRRFLRRHEATVDNRLVAFDRRGEPARPQLFLIRVTGGGFQAVDTIRVRARR